MKTIFKKSGAVNSAVLWSGPSQIDGAPIALIAVNNSSNRKTGGMLQTYIIRTDIDPVSANRTGLDRSICGDCPLKGTVNPDKKTGTAEKRPCYVVLGQGPAMVYKSYLKGNYPALALDYSPAAYDITRHTIESDHCALLTAYGAGLNIRCGTYGDPAAVPSWVWKALLKQARGFTGYSHQFGAIGPGTDQDLAKFCMVSVDDYLEARGHWAQNRRTFRIVQSIAEVDRFKEVVCPATPEGGSRTNCDNCNLCAGSSVSAKSVAVVAHGSGAKHIPAVNV